MTRYYVTDGSLKLRHVGILELGAFYTWMQRWFDFELSWQNSNEKEYKEVILPGGDKNIEMKWEIKAEVTGYFNYVINLEFTFIAVSDTEIQFEGKRKKVQKGDFEVRINSYVETKTQNINPMFRTILEKILLRKRIESHKKDLFNATMGFHDEVKKIFQQYT